MLSIPLLLPCLLAQFPQAPVPSGAPAPLVVNCQPQWVPTFGQEPGTDADVLCECVFDDGSGPALYVGGSFRHAGGIAASSIARWDGVRWSIVGLGLDPAAPYLTDNFEVRALTVFDDGSGPALYAGGNFPSSNGTLLNGIARWNGSSWSALGAGLNSNVSALCVYDDGSGAALYAGGAFATSGGTALHSIARWTGTSWAPLGTGVNGAVYALCSHDDGTGPALYAGGMFSAAGGLPASAIARWDGSAWSALGAGMGNSAPQVSCLRVYDDGAGRKLYAGGSFDHAGGALAANIAAWDGAGWAHLGSGTSGRVYALLVFDDGTGARLYVGGGFQMAGGQVSRAIARWDGTQWGTQPALFNGAVHALAEFDGGFGPELHAGGTFYASGGGYNNVPHVARRGSGPWMPLGAGVESVVSALAGFDDGSGPALYVAGTMPSANDLPLRGLAKWNGSAWSAAGTFYPINVGALCVFDDGSGPALYAGGQFLMVDGLYAQHVARWNGSVWLPLGGGVNFVVTCFGVFDDGTGAKLYAGGNAAWGGSCLASWDGSIWTTLGGVYPIPVVSALCSFDDGSGNALYVAGYVPGSTVGIARWNGTSWSGVGSAGMDGSIFALAVHDDGTGRALYAGGKFTTAGGVYSPSIARWNGTAWTAVGAGLSSVPNALPTVAALETFDDGSGSALYATGALEASGAISLPGIARWDGTSWSAVGSGIRHDVYDIGLALAAYDCGSGRALYAGGKFHSCSDSQDSNLAVWGTPPGCGFSGDPFCFPGEQGVLACPCGNPPAGHGPGCENSSATGGARLDAAGHASLAGDTLQFSTFDEKPSAASIVIQGTQALGNGVVFGQGVRCVGGTLRRMYLKTAVGGSILAPGPGDPTVSARSASLGDPIAQGSHRFYGVYYRDPQVLGSCPATSTVNLTQQLDVLWVL